MVKFQKFYVTDGTTKARVSYHLDNRGDKLKCVTMYAQDYTRELSTIFEDNYVNNSDSQTDYFEKGRVVLFETHPEYQKARARAEQNIADYAAKRAKRQAKQHQTCNIVDVNPGDTVLHDGIETTVCRTDIRKCHFMGVTLFGDSYRLGTKPVTLVTRLAA